MLSSLSKAAFFAVVLAGCADTAEGTATPAPPPPVSTGSPVAPAIDWCAPLAGTCAEADARTKLDDRWTGTLVRFGSEQPYVRLAVFADGTLRRSAPDNWVRLHDIVGHLSASSLARLAGLLDAAPDDTFRPFFGADKTGTSPVVIGRGRDGASACFNPIRLSQKCDLPASVLTLNTELASLRDRTYAQWKAATAGTVSLDTEITPRSWPLARELPVSSFSLTVTKEECQALAVPNGQWPVFRRADGAYVNVSTTPKDATSCNAFAEVWPSVELPEDATELREELLAKIGQSGDWYGKRWVGVPLGADQFPRYKGKMLLSIPSADGDVHFYRLMAIESLELTGEL